MQQISLVSWDGLVSWDDFFCRMCCFNKIICFLEVTVCEILSQFLCEIISWGNLWDALRVDLLVIWFDSRSILIFRDIICLSEMFCFHEVICFLEMFHEKIFEMICELICFRKIISFMRQFVSWDNMFREIIYFMRWFGDLFLWDGLF